MRIFMVKNAVNRKTQLLTSKLNTFQEEIGQMLCLENCILWLRDLETKNIGAEVFGELQNVVLEDNGENKMVRESDQ